MKYFTSPQIKAIAEYKRKVEFKPFNRSTITVAHNGITVGYIKLNNHDSNWVYRSVTVIT